LFFLFLDAVTALYLLCFIAFCYFLNLPQKAAILTFFCETY